MQTIPLVNTTMASAITGSTVSLRPVSSYIGVLTIILSQTGSTNPAIPTTVPTVDLQGSLDGVNWVTISSTSMSSTTITKPLGVSTDFGAGTGGYRSFVQVVQGMPQMRICTSAGLTNGANATITATFANG
jgi:hypothetical protein